MIKKIILLSLFSALVCAPCLHASSGQPASEQVISSTDSTEHDIILDTATAPRRILDVITPDENIQNIITGYVNNWYHLRQAPFRNFQNPTANNIQFLPGLPVLAVTDLSTFQKRIIATYAIEKNTDEKADPQVTPVIAPEMIIEMPSEIRFKGRALTIASCKSSSSGANAQGNQTIGKPLFGISDINPFFEAMAYSARHNILAIAPHGRQKGIELYDLDHVQNKQQNIVESLPEAIVSHGNIMPLISRYLGCDHEKLKMESTVLSMAISPNGQYLVAGEMNGNLRLYDLLEKKMIWNHETNYTPAAHSQIGAHHSGSIYALAIHDNTIYSASHDGTVRSWDLLTGKHISQISETAAKPVSSLALSSDGRYLVAGSSDSTFEIYANTAAQLKKYLSN